MAAAINARYIWGLTLFWIVASLAARALWMALASIEKGVGGPAIATGACLRISRASCCGTVEAARRTASVFDRASLLQADFTRG